jgi:hypothetical protein
MPANAKRIQDNAEKVATMYLCGADAATCREAQIPELVQKLVFQGKIYSTALASPGSKIELKSSLI